jgi:hypothetical protein
LSETEAQVEKEAPVEETTAPAEEVKAEPVAEETKSELHYPLVEFMLMPIDTNHHHLQQ